MAKPTKLSTRLLKVEALEQRQLLAGVAEAEPVESYAISAPDPAAMKEWDKPIDLGRKRRGKHHGRNPGAFGGR